VLIQTVMTYWYLGVREVVEDVRQMGSGRQDRAGGQLCHALSEFMPVPSDRICAFGGADLEPLWRLLEASPRSGAAGLVGDLWTDRRGGSEAVGRVSLSLHVLFLRTAVYGGFKARSLDRLLAELSLLVCPRCKGRSVL